MREGWYERHLVHFIIQCDICFSIIIALFLNVSDERETSDHDQLCYLYSDPYPSLEFIHHQSLDYVIWFGVESIVVESIMTAVRQNKKLIKTYVTLVGCWSVIGALILGWSVNIMTKNIARCMCNIAGPYEGPTIHKLKNILHLQRANILHCHRANIL